MKIVVLTPDKEIFEGTIVSVKVPGVNGQFQVPVKLGDHINNPQAEYNSFIAADESYLIFTSFVWGRGSGGGDLFISFRNTDGSWTKARNLKVF